MTLYWVTRILVLSQLLTGVLSTCDCSFTAPQKIDPLLSPQAFILGAYDESGNPCVPTANTCILPIQSGNASWGLTGFALSTLTNPSKGSVVVIFRNQDNSVIGTYTSGPDPQDLTSQNKGLSNTAVATVKIDYIGVDPKEPNVKIVGSIIRVFSLNTATVRPSTAKPTPVPTYAGPIHLNGNPQLISNDIFFAVDIGKGSGDSAAFTEMMGVVNSIVGLLAVTEDATSTTQTRITVGSLSPVAGYSVFGNTWQTSQADVKNILGFQKIGRAQSVYQTALSGAFDAVKGPFGLKNPSDSTQNSRPTTTRLYIIVTTADPEDFDSTTFRDSGYADVDAHPIVLAYKYTGTQLANLTTNGWSFFNMPDNSNDNIGAFVSKYLLNGDATCPLVLDPPSQPTSDGSALVDMGNLNGHGHSHQTTPGYKGPNPDDVPTPATWTRNDGQNGRYCNFQNSNTYYKANAGNGIKFTVYYELEPEKDYLRFFDANWNELAAFTGYDVSGTNFIFTGGDVRVQFVTDEKNVYGGFQIVAENVLLPPTVKPTV